MNSDRRHFLKLAASAALWSLAAPNRMGGAAPTPALKSQRLLLIHGRAQQGRDPEAIRQEWLDTLERGGRASGLALPPAVQVALPYYGDTLDDYAGRSEIPLTSDIRSRGTPMQDEFLVFQAQFAEALRVRAGVTDEQVDAEYGDDPQVRGPLNWRWVQAILRAIDKHVPGMNRRALETFTRDVFLYIAFPGVRDDIDEIVASALTTEPTTVVGHSLGSVVAYSVLRNDRRDLQVPLLVTVGSPLGVRAVRDQFRPLRTSRHVAGWFNALDPTDVVALYQLDGRNFPVKPAVENYAEVRNHTDNRHGIAGYLDDPVVAKRILATFA